MHNVLLRTLLFPSNSENLKNYILLGWTMLFTHMGSALVGAHPVTLIPKFVYTVSNSFNSIKVSTWIFNFAEIEEEDKNFVVLKCENIPLFIDNKGVV